MIRLTLTAAAFAFAAHQAAATPIAPGGTLNFSMPGTTSVYAVEGNGGGGGSTAAIEVTFAAGTNNVFTFAASGIIDCCTGGPDPNFTPDGAVGGASIGALNGISGSLGNSRLPIMGVFTDGTNPAGGTAPASVFYSRGAISASVSPALLVTFYIGDGLTGYNDSNGNTIMFTAPSNATKLFLGMADSFGFSGAPNAYGDNDGAFNVDVSLKGTEVPVPASAALLASAMAGSAFLVRRRSQRS